MLTIFPCCSQHLQIDADSRPSTVGPPFTGHYNLVADTPRGLQTFQPTRDVKYEPGKAYKPTEDALKKAWDEANPDIRERFKQDMNLEIRRNIYDQKGKDLAADAKEKQQTNGEETSANGNFAGDLTKKTIEDIAKEPKKEIFCSSCSIDCTRQRYHFARKFSDPVKIKSLDVCPACFQEGRISQNTNYLDFVLLKENPDEILDKDASWNDTELLLLLEGLERFDENWIQIADHVGTRSREECVVKFLQLEIEDKYFEPDVSGPGYGDSDAGRMPFSQADNPVLSVLGFLAGLSEPSVAAAAAGRSVDQVTKIWRKRIENGVGGPADETSKPMEKAKADGAMDVDIADSPHATDGNQVTISSNNKQGDAMRDIANTTFATSAARAAALASNEEREMTRLVSAAVNTTLQKFELKLQQFSEMEAMLQAERRELERGRQQLFLDRLAFRKRVAETQEALQKASLKGGEEGARMALEVPVGGGERLAFQSEGGGVVGEPPSGGVSYEI